MIDRKSVKHFSRKSEKLGSIAVKFDKILVEILDSARVLMLFMERMINF